MSREQRLEQARGLERSAARLAQLCAIGAPEFIIEVERQLLARRLAQLPVDNQALEQVRAAEAGSCLTLDNKGPSE